eukprot:CAMPEP_0204169000 /NCGR_PEP_ID=MMETSP0361-20130328/41196_1 /ASSEMBLY_ACC=CAM_ASM_000343 /TAXON_ID=268821 /ORGANISM="Scrippsiella Hangoei, Strain SHTV-5" /LENGTH=128 /DNA_ID=CAMNT_0051126533 /DNA_START=59 /DNA_END=442 /DNA_ORIENTATION=+
MAWTSPMTSGCRSCFHAMSRCFHAGCGCLWLNSGEDALDGCGLGSGLLLCPKPLAWVRAFVPGLPLRGLTLTLGKLQEVLAEVGTEEACGGPQDEEAAWASLVAPLCSVAWDDPWRRPLSVGGTPAAA